MSSARMVEIVSNKRGEWYGLELRKIIANEETKFDK